MRSIKLLIMSALLTFTWLWGCTSKAEQKASADDKPNMLVCYFSATGTTAKAAQRIADIAGADIYEITPRELYTDADLDWRDSLSRSTVEMHNRSFRPAIVDSFPDMSRYDVVFIGYPNWWNTHPNVINTFIEANDFQGKKLVPFMTSGGSNILNSEKELKESYPGLTFSKGLLMNNVTDDQIRDWVDEVVAL